MSRGLSATGRIHALSDGVFAVALTLLTFNVVAAATTRETGVSLARHLQHQWPTFVSFLVGFMTIFVCWINHHFVYDFINHADAGLHWVNGVQLALVSLVPFPTAVLAASINGASNDRRAALLLYGAMFFCIATSFWGLWRYAQRRGLADPAANEVLRRGMGFNYGLSSVWTIACLAVAAFSVIPALVMWALMFMVFAFPTSFAEFTGQRRATRPTTEGSST